MKNIKYRAAHYNYDGTFNGFTYWGKIDLLGEFSESSFAGHTNRRGTTIKADEMFIGMEDMNSQQIYEGDIISNGIEGSIFKVCYSEDCAAFLAVGLNDEWDQLIHEYIPQSLEVIGNIHEKETQHLISASNPHQEEE